jgi:hypothetical protein
MMTMGMMMMCYVSVDVSINVPCVYVCVRVLVCVGVGGQALDLGPVHLNCHSGYVGWLVGWWVALVLE